MPLTLTRAALGLQLTLPGPLLEGHLAATPEVVGRELARAVMGEVNRHGLGYYPPLGYFSEHGGIDAELLAAAEHIGWFGATLVREEVGRRLRPRFSMLNILGIQVLAFGMPGVRPRQLNLLKALSRHYTPDRIRLNLEVANFQRRADPEALIAGARQLTIRGLRHSFSEIEITSSHAGDPVATAPQGPGSG